MYQKLLNDIDIDKKKKEKILNDSMIKLNKYIDEEKNKITDIENTLKNKQILKYGSLYDKNYLVEKINLSLIGYYENNSEDKNISFAPIRGGCLSEINNELSLKDISHSQIEEINNLILKIIESPNSEEINFNGKKFIKITINLQQGNLNEDFCQNFINFNGDSKRKMIESIKNEENINIKDEYNNNSGIYKILNGNPEKIINCKEIKETNIFGENAAFYLQTDEDVEKLKSFGDKSILETETKNDLNPLLISLMEQNREVSNALVNYISPSLLNSSNETK